jgi:luciferase-like monooxygenase
MNDELLTMVEREVLSWPGVSKETHRGGRGQGGFWVPPATVYRFGRRQIGHVHHGDAGLADFSFPREVREELIRSGRAIPHPAFPDSRTSASYRVRSAEDVPGAVELFRRNYERAKESVERRGAQRRS